MSSDAPSIFDEPISRSSSGSSFASVDVQIPWPEDGIRGFASLLVTGWVLAYYLVSLVLFRMLPATEVLGTKLRESGKPLQYRFNGELSGPVHGIISSWC